MPRPTSAPAQIVADTIVPSVVVLGIDAHKRSHTVVAVDERGRQLSTKTSPRS
jgi:hypothetical protein